MEKLKFATWMIFTVKQLQFSVAHLHAFTDIESHIHKLNSQHSYERKRKKRRVELEWCTTRKGKLNTSACPLTKYEYDFLCFLLFANRFSIFLVFSLSLSYFCARSEHWMCLCQLKNNVIFIFFEHLPLFLLAKRTTKNSKPANGYVINLIIAH